MGTHTYIFLVLGLIIGGLVICLLADKAVNATLKLVFWWFGIIVACCGLFLGLAPIILFIARNLREAIGA